MCSGLCWGLQGALVYTCAMLKTLSASLWPLTMVFKTASGKTKPCLPPFYFSNNNQFILPSSKMLGGHVILMCVAVKKLKKKKAVLSNKVSQLTWPASCFSIFQLYQSHFLMDSKPWTRLDTQVSKPSPAVPPSSSLSLLNPGSPSNLITWMMPPCFPSHHLHCPPVIKSGSFFVSESFPS